VRRLAPLPWPADPLPELDEPRVFVHVLDGPAERGLLTKAERERADRLVTEDLQRRWIRARGGLRQVLGAYSGVAPAALAVKPAACVHCGEPHGKPHLPGADWLRFNLSHSGELAVIAVADGREVGVDIEATDGGRRLDDIAARFFGPAEADEVRRLGDPAFYRLWTRKEAYLKATAEGLAAGLHSVDANELESRPGWEFADLDLGDGYAGAVAVAPPGFRPTAPAGGARRSR
jgi:4'-phosphopantetheinyl transferase